MIKFGLISELGTDENKGYARVWFDDVDIVSDWLALPSIATKTAKQWVPIEINSQVACVIDDDTEQGYISIVLWSDTDTPPEWATEDTMGIMFADGAEFYYDAKAHTLTVNAPDSELNLTCKTLNVTGAVNIEGETSIKGDTSIKGETNIDGDLTATKDVSAENVKASADVSANNVKAQVEVSAGALGIKLTMHKHATPVGPSGPSLP
ncbi:hypothetical protein AGMMS49525_02590 [Bacteroidia bacterium]|nr:hypothetical protein AGMMS49525_02590 [Bacteroidia bacterium]